MKKFIKFILVIVMLLLTVSWLASVVYGQTNGDTEQTNIQMEATPSEALPKVDFFGNAIGSVTPGDIYYINATGSLSDISLDLYISNCDELIHNLRYFILKVAVYMEDANGQWQKIASSNGTALPDTYITLQNSPVSFTLPGLARYKITIESGSYHSFPFHANNGDISPSFYLTVNPV